MLDKLAKYHNEWLKILYSFGCGYDDANDIVQDMYLKINRLIELDKIAYNDSINKYYIYTTLKNLYIDRIKQNAKSVEYLDISSEEDEPYNEDKSEAMDKILGRIFKDVSELTTFETRLFELYWDLPLNPNVTYSGANRSQRDIAFGSDVSLTTIHKHLKRIKDQLTEKYAEDVEDYFNSEYDRI